MHRRGDRTRSRAYGRTLRAQQRQIPTAGVRRPPPRGEGRRKCRSPSAVLPARRCPRPRPRQARAAGAESRAGSLQRAPGAAFGRRPIHRRGLRCRSARGRQDRGQAARGHAGRDRSAKLAATQPDRSPETGRKRRPGRLQRRFRRAGVRRTGPRAGRDRELVGAHRRRTRLRFRHWRHTARALPLLDPGDGSEAGVAAGTMIRIAIVFICTCALASPLPAMVGGAPPTSEGAGRAVVMLTGSHGTFCSGVALARDLVLTAAHCVLPGANYKLVEFDAARQPALKALAIIARHPDLDVNAVLRHRVTADVALIKLAASLKLVPALLAPAGGSVAAGDRFVVAGYGVAVRGDGKTGGTVRAATLVATGQPGTLQIRLADPATKGERAGLGACTGDSGAPVYRDVGGALAVIGVVSWSTGPALSEGCGGLTGVTPL